MPFAISEKNLIDFLKTNVMLFYWALAQCINNLHNNDENREINVNKDPFDKILVSIELNIELF